MGVGDLASSASAVWFDFKFKSKSKSKDASDTPVELQRENAELKEMIWSMLKLVDPQFRETADEMIKQSTCSGIQTTRSIRECYMQHFNEMTSAFPACPFSEAS